MNLDDEELLGHVLDAFDRLYDNESAVHDVHALLFATAKGLTDESWMTDVAAVASALETLLSQAIPVDESRRRALETVQPLRERVAGAISAAFVAVVENSPFEEADRKLAAWLDERGLRRDQLDARDLMIWSVPHRGERGYAIRRALVNEGNPTAGTTPPSQ